MRRAALLAVLLAGAVPVSARDGAGYYPFDVNLRAYSGMGISSLKSVGEKPIWHGPEDGLVRQTRFVFSDGYSIKTRILHIRERSDGSGTLHVFSVDHRSSKPSYVERSSVIKLNVAAIRKINRLAETSGTFGFESGTWDDEGDFFTHCQILEMERIDALGYRYSSVNIGCNQPAKLMPLVEHVMALAGIKRRDPQLL